MCETNLRFYFIVLKRYLKLNSDARLISILNADPTSFTFPRSRLIFTRAINTCVFGFHENGRDSKFMCERLEMGILATIFKIVAKFVN